MTRKEKLLNFISDKDYRPMNIKDIMSILSVPKESRTELEEILSELESEGKIYKNNKNCYVLMQDSGYIKGIFEAKSSGYGFVLTENDEKYFIAPTMTGGAFNKDNVLIKVTRLNNSAQKCSEAKIVRVLSHGTDTVVGTFSKERNFGFVIPDNKSFGSDIYISKKHSTAALNGQKVLVKITKWPTKNENPEGIIEKVLGYEHEKNVDIQSVILEHGLTEEFPEKVVLSALSFGSKVYEEELSEREDFRQRLIFTIDGNDSKDFDDAVEIEKTSNGYRLGVHIADVSYYVAENSALDIEARKRGTSVYFPGQVIPMLPKTLSNGICSLNPGCDRLTLSVIMYFDNDANLTEHKICESVICSKYRMTYDDVTLMLENDKEMCTRYEELLPSIVIMNELREKLKAKRMSKGSIDFNFPEVKVVLDDSGKAIDVYKYKSTAAHSLIEEFMLAANVCIAEEMFWSDIPFIYRVHEKPSYEKVKSFASVLSFMGLSLKGKYDNLHPRSFSDILDKIQGSPKELMISKIMLRSLMKAKYSEENLGHFGLSFKYYCHFTSPIRRYPDLVIHRIIKEHLKYGLTDNRKRFLTKFVAKAAKSSSEAEINAMEAERDVDDMKKAEYMSQHIGDKYSATITSVTSFGIFAETEFGIEGLISLTDLADDYYEYNEKNYTLTGKHSGKVYSIGDELTIGVKRANAKLREIDFIIESDDENE